MNKSKIFKIAVRLVAVATGLAATVILRGRNEESSNARYMVVQLVYRYMTDEALAHLMQRSRQSVTYIRNNTKKMRHTSIATILPRLRQDLAKELEG